MKAIVSGTIISSENKKLVGKKSRVIFNLPKEDFSIGELIKCTVRGFSCTLKIEAFG